MEYFRRVRPFGLWSPVRRMLADSGENPSRPPHDRYDIPVALAGTAFFVFLYLIMMDLVLHHWSRIALSTTVCLALALFLYHFWWRQLPREEHESAAPLHTTEK
jgi:hypothetical protein